MLASGHDSAHLPPSAAIRSAAGKAVRGKRRLGTAAALATIALAVAAPGASAKSSFLSHFSRVDQIASTVPANGDVNPYGTVVVPRSDGKLHRDDVLVSNFNDSANAQGTGTTIMEISRNGGVSTFAEIPKTTCASTGGVGLTTALTALRSGFVVVGSLPTSDGTAATAQAGCLIVLNSHGNVVETFADADINGPWDMTAADHGDSATLFVTNVLNGTVAAAVAAGTDFATQQGPIVDGGTVLRLVLRIPDRGLPHITSERVIGTGFAERTDPNALVLGPTGVALRGETLYVADTTLSRIAKIPDALDRHSAAGGGGVTVSSDSGLNQPLGMALAPNGDLLTVNGGDGNIVETTPSGSQFPPLTIAPQGGGALFGLAIAPNGRGVYFVNDADNTLKLLH